MLLETVKLLPKHNSKNHLRQKYLPCRLKLISFDKSQNAQTRTGTKDPGDVL